MPRQRLAPPRRRYFPVADLLPSGALPLGPRLALHAVCTAINVAVARACIPGAWLCRRGHAEEGSPAEGSPIKIPAVPLTATPPDATGAAAGPEPGSPPQPAEAVGAAAGPPSGSAAGGDQDPIRPNLAEVRERVWRLVRASGPNTPYESEVRLDR